MSDAPGRYARWSAAALVAPVSAAVFTGSVSWAAGHHPQAVTTSTTSKTSATAPAGSGQAAGISEEELNAQLEQIEALRAQIGTLRAQVAALTDPGAGPATAGARSTGKAMTATVRPSASSAPKTTRAPATHTTTGASG